MPRTLPSTPRTDRPPPAPGSPQLLRQVQTFARVLRLPLDLLDTCATVGDIQVLATPAYHALARRYHPDAQAGLLASGKAPSRLATGATFRRIAAAYQALMALEPAISLTHALPPLPLQNAMMRETWHHRQAARCGPGWQEVPHGW